MSYFLRKGNTKDYYFLPGESGSFGVYKETPTDTGLHQFEISIRQQKNIDTLKSGKIKVIAHNFEFIGKYYVRPKVTAFMTSVLRALGVTYK